MGEGCQLAGIRHPGRFSENSMVKSAEKAFSPPPLNGRGVFSPVTVQHSTDQREEVMNHGSDENRCPHSGCCGRCLGGRNPQQQVGSARKGKWLLISGNGATRSHFLTPEDLSVGEKLAGSRSTSRERRASKPSREKPPVSDVSGRISSPTRGTQGPSFLATSPENPIFRDSSAAGRKPGVHRCFRMSLMSKRCGF